MDSNFNKLLEKYLNGQMTREELEGFIKRLDENDPEDAKVLYQRWRTLDNASYFSAQESVRMLQNIKQKIHQQEPQQHAAKVFFLAGGWKKTAAVLAGFMVVSVLCLLLLNRSPEIVYATDYGEIKNIVLPDSSVVTLNARSSLSYKNNWEQHNCREVFLEGEAFFSVIHRKNDQKFIVHTRQLDIEVLGTKFNVNHRREKTEVVLNSGKVMLRSEQQKQANHVIMQPGEMVTVEGQNFIKKHVDAALYTTWKENKLIFDGTSLADIAQILADNYGLEVIIKDTGLAAKKFKGEVPADQVESLLGQIAKVFNAEIQRNGKQVIIQPIKK